jgi:hypothetical protein
MNADRILSNACTAFVSISLAIVFTGCQSKQPSTDDASVNMQVQARLFADQNLAGQQVQATVLHGVVSLNGSVTNDTARTIASGDVAQVPGVKTVVDNLVVQANPTAPTQVSTNPRAVPPPAAQKNKKPTASVTQSAPFTQNAPPPQIQPMAQAAPQPAPAQVVAQTPPPPPPVPVVHNITLPAGTAIPVRITQTLDSATTQTGDKFTGAVASDIIEDGMVVLAQGTPVTGHVDAVQDAAHFKGSSLLTISLTAIDRHGEHIQVSTEAFSKQGEGRGKNTAEKIGGGAAVGAILGGILGGGRGAAIGSVAGGGVGAGANTVTRGQQVQIPSETVVRFKLSDAIIVRITPGANTSANSVPTLEHHDNP